jgi:four helix bundle protein
MLIRSFQDLVVYQRAHSLAMELFRLSKKFPKEEKFSMTDQVRRASRSVAANIAEAWGKRRYPASFVNKLTDSEGECYETQAWIRFAVDCEYVEVATGAKLLSDYEELLRSIIHMSNRPDDWCFPGKKAKQ